MRTHACAWKSKASVSSEEGPSRGQPAHRERARRVPAAHVLSPVFQGLQPINGGLGNPFGDGLRCVTGSLVRMGANFAMGGEVDFGYGVAGDPLVHVAGGIPPSGGTREYQIWYRNAIAFCSPATFNLTNAVSLTWSP